MGVDLTLLPITENKDKTWGYAHTVLACTRDYVLYDRLRALPDEPVPASFTAYVARIPDGEMKGEHCYGHVTYDAYEEPLRCVRAGELVTYRIRRRANTNQQNQAVWAYLAALPPETRVALYWH